jgi:hypothetical protein
MSTYDKVAFGDRPVLYLSAPDTTDKSGGSYALSNNDLSPTGQPIIYGSEFSFVMDDAKTVDVTGNPLFFNATSTFECVIVAREPVDDIPIVIDDDNQNALYITSEGITLKLFFDSELSTYTKSITVPVYNWDVKLYIVLAVTNSQATLSVNGQAEVLTYTDTVINSTNIKIGGGTDYQYLIDGIGFYENTARNKSKLINDPGSGYTTYAAVKLGGRTTKFDGYQSGYLESFTIKDFLYTNAPDQYTLVYVVAEMHDGLDYITVRCNNEKANIAYDVNLDEFGEFKEYLMLNALSDATLRFVINAEDISPDFKLTIEGIYNGDVLNATPANLELAGLALYGPGSESIVNYPDGTKLPGATYTGTWILSDDFAAAPQSIEIVFKPVESANDTIVFSSADGQASFGPTGAITGFDAYLNGQLVTDLSDIRYNQWNHLILIDTTPAAEEFYLNSDDGVDSDETISYMLLTGYQQELTTDEIQQLYEIVTGIDMLGYSETIAIAEGVFDDTAFNVYSHTWAIVGAGGT